MENFKTMKTNKIGRRTMECKIIEVFILNGFKYCLVESEDFCGEFRIILHYNTGFPITLGAGGINYLTRKASARKSINNFLDYMNRNVKNMDLSHFSLKENEINNDLDDDYFSKNNYITNSTIK